MQEGRPKLNGPSLPLWIFFQNAVSIASWKIFFSLPLSSFLLKEKKKAIWCQIHSWHIIKGSTKNVPEKLKAKPQPYNMNLIAASHNFRVARSPEIKPLPLHRKKRKSKAIRSLKNDLMCTYYVQNTLQVLEIDG